MQITNDRNPASPEPIDFAKMLAFPKPQTRKRIESIDVLRGAMMIIMALDHVRDYFHYDAFYYDPTNLQQTTPFLFFTRFITHYCAPIFVFLAGTSAFLSGRKKSKKELSMFLFTRGLWLLLVEFFIISLLRSFNPSYSYFNLQVIWAIGISMVLLAGLVYLRRSVLLGLGILIVFGHNMLDSIQVPGDGLDAFVWALVHKPRTFHFGNVLVAVNYPFLAWLGIMIVGYCAGWLFTSYYDANRRVILFSFGCTAIMLFVILRNINSYGDPAPWITQSSFIYSLLSFFNVTKYPPSLMYTLITVGPGLVFLSLFEKPLQRVSSVVAVYGRVPMFYYLLHILLIHIFACVTAVASGYPIMLRLKNSVYRTPELQGYGYNLAIVYAIWIALTIMQYPLCKWFDRYKRKHQSTKWWLSYL